MSSLDPALQLVGLWGGERLLGPEVRGHLVVSPYPTGWVLVLSQTGKGVWQGEVVPLEDELSIYLVVRRDTDGTPLPLSATPSVTYGAESSSEFCSRAAQFVRLTEATAGMGSTALTPQRLI